MAKIIRVFFVIFFCIGLGFGAQLDERLAKFDKFFDHANKNGKLAFHQDIKGIYIKSIIDNDKDMRVETLKRLIKSSKALGLGAKPYEKELASLGDDKVNKKGSENKKQSGDTQKIVTLDKAQPLKIVSIIKNNNNLEIKFNRPIDKSDIKSSRLNSKGTFRSIYDFKGVWTSKSHTFKNVLTDEIRVSQFNKNTIRVVFSGKKEQKLEFETYGNSLYFALAGDKIAIPKQPKESKSSKKSESQPDDDGDEAPQIASKVTKKGSASGKIIVLDAGHGGDDPGAINGKLKEKNIVLSIAGKTGEELRKRGYKVYYTRTKDKFINLRDRTKFANDKLADLFISIHANAAPNKSKAASMRGIETFFLSPARSERSKNVAALENKSDIDEMNFFSKQTFLNFLNREKIISSNKLAIDIQREVLVRAKRLNSKTIDGGVREAPFWVLVGALMPAVLLEVGYITHPDEGALIAKSSYQDAIARGIADGIDVYFANQR